MDGHIQKYVDRLGESCDFSLFTENPAIVKICLSYGFRLICSVHVDELGADADLYTKTYLPCT